MNFGPYHIDGVPCHEIMKGIIEQIQELYPIGSIWYSRVGDTVQEVISYEAGGILFQSTATTGMFGKRCQDKTIYDYESLLSGRMILQEDMVEDVSEYFIG